MIGTDVTRDRSTHFQRYFSKAGLTPGSGDAGGNREKKQRLIYRKKMKGHLQENFKEAVANS